MAGRKRIEVETTVVLFQQEDGWHIRLQFADGQWFTSDQAFTSKDAAEVAFYQWRAQIGAEMLTVQ
jgi:hypothetical protein